MNNPGESLLAELILSKNNRSKCDRTPAHDWFVAGWSTKKEFSSNRAGAPEPKKYHDHHGVKVVIGHVEVLREAKDVIVRSDAWREIVADTVEVFDCKYHKANDLRVHAAPAGVFAVAGPKLIVTAVRRERVGVWVSSKTRDYIAEELTDTPSCEDDVRALAAKKIEYSMRALINSIAEGIRDKGQATKFDVAANGRFSDGFARAILFRLPVGFYKESLFIESLYRDFEVAVSAGKISHTWWDVSMSSSRVITITIKNETPMTVEGDRPWKKARAIRFSSLKRK